MTTTKISSLTAKTSPSGAEELLINDNGVSKKITIANLPDSDTTYSEGTGITLTGTVFSLTDESYTTTEKNKLAGIETSANNYSHPNHTGDVTSNSDGTTTIQNGAVDIPMLSATGSPSSSTFLRGDNTWATPTGAVLSVDNNTGAITAAQLKASYESNLDTNEFSDVLLTKLNGIESNATGDQTDAEIRSAVASATNSNVFTDAEQTKLSGIADNANNYSLPSSVVHDNEKGALHATDALRISGHNVYLYKGDGTFESVTVPDNDTTYSNATTSSSGLMSNTDKSKLDNIASNANNYSHPTTSGNKHIPSGGSAGQILEYSADGTAQWATPASGGGGATDIDGLSDGHYSSTSHSIGLGTGALASEDTTVSRQNVASGYHALYSTTTGWGNVATGYWALRNNTTGYRNTASGSHALNNSNANNNTAFGYYALRSNTSGYENTASGSAALRYNLSGYRNTASGCQALINNSTGSKNIGLGYNAQSTSATTSGECTLGDTSITNLRCNDTTISGLSDKRDKAEITNLPDSAGLDFINNLRPVTFYWDRREWYDDGVDPDGSKIKRDYRSWKTNSGQRMGFIAQEVLEATQPHKFMKDSQVVSTENEDRLEFAPAHLITPLVKAVQQLTARVAELEAKLGE